MTNDNPSAGNDPARPTATCAANTRSRIYNASYDLTMLIGMIDGVSVIYDAVETNIADNPVAARAANAMPPLLNAIIEEANRINGDLDLIEREGFGDDA